MILHLRHYVRGLLGCLLGTVLAVACTVGFVLQLVGIVLSIVVVGWLVLPATTAVARLVCRWSRRWAAWNLQEPVVGVPLAPRERTVAGRAQEILLDAATWRELAWMLLHVPLGLVESFLCVVPWVGTHLIQVDARLAAGLLNYGQRNSEPPLPADHASGPVGPGHGLVGMRERVDLLGGTLHVGPTPPGGFEVHAIIPLPQEGDQRAEV